MSRPCTCPQRYPTGCFICGGHEPTPLEQLAHQAGMTPHELRNHLRQQIAKHQQQP